MPRWLYRYEAKGIQGYVLASSRLKEIAGASALVEDLADDADAWARDADPTRQRLVAAAGNAMFVFSSRDALEDFAAHWPVFCEQTRPGLHLVQAWCELAGDAPTPAELATLFARIEAARNRPTAALPEAGPLVARAGRSGLPAVDDAAGVLVDDAARARLRAFDEDRDNRDTGLVQRLTRDLPRIAGGRPRLAFDLERFPPGYLAVIHADGNGIGRFFLEGRIPFEDLGGFSQQLGEATTRAARTAVDALDRAHNRPREERRELPFRPVVLGGDDLTVITLASDAMAFTELFLARFEAETATGLARWISASHPRGFTACAGIAMVRRGFPFHVAYDLAEALCAHAKRARRDRSDDPRSSLMFHRVTTAAVTDWDDIVRDERTCEGGGSLVGGPWHVGGDEHRSLQSLRELARLIAERAVPRGPVREWMSVAQRDVAAGDRHWRRIVEVLSDDADGRKVARALADTLRALGAEDDSVWREDRTTPVADAVEWLAVDKDVQDWSPGGVR